jgi:hypothetical protein
MAWFEDDWEESQRRHREEELDLRQRLLTASENPELHRRLGLSLMFQGRFEEAVDQMHAALHVDPEYGPAYEELWVLYVMGFDVSPPP